MKQKLPNSNGFTLVETLIGIAIVGLSAMALAQMNSFSSGQYRQSRDSKDVAALAQNFGEAMLLSTNSDGSLSEGTHTQYFDMKGNPLVPTPDGAIPDTARYQVGWNVVPDTPVIGIIQVSLHVGSSQDSFQPRLTMDIYRPTPGQKVDRALNQRPPVTVISVPTVVPPPVLLPVHDGQ